MNVDSAHKSRWEIAEVVFGIPFLISVAIHFVVPFSLPQGIFRQILTPMGIILIIIGIGFVVLARREFAYFNQPTDPGHPTSKVVNTGVFGISRNPLYLASVILFLGLALALNMLWAVVMLLFSIVICIYVLIIPEEQYLAAKFGEEYKEYTASVHRWLGRK
jgi:protein-S-isoprenylcysteine O-methyltransferase Ste14